MKKIFLLLLSTTLFLACEEKDKDPSPELSAQVAGNYKVTRLEIDGKNVPLTSVSVGLEFEKFSAEVVTGTMSAKIDGEPEEKEDLGSLNLKSAGSTGIDIYEGTLKIGNLDKSEKLTIFVEYEGQEFEIVADKM